MGEDEGGVVDALGDLESDLLFGNTYGAVSRLFSGTFWSSAGKRLTYDISADVRVGDSTKPGEFE